MNLRIISEIVFIELSSRQLSQYVDACAVFDALDAAEQRAAKFRGTMFVRTVGDRSYLIRRDTRGQQRSIGPITEENRFAAQKFTTEKAAIEERVKQLRSELDIHRKLNRSLRVGRAPSIMVRALQALKDAGVDRHFLVVGTHALFAYEQRAGVLFPGDALATQDVDLLLDTRKRAQFLAQLDKVDMSLVDLLRRADKTFEIKQGDLCTLVNASGFEIDVIRRMATDKDEHPMRATAHEDDIWPVQVATGDKLLGAAPYEQIVVASTGEMARMRTIAPSDYARVKRELGKRKDRDPLKARKDLLQADLVEKLMTEYLPDQLG